MNLVNIGVIASSRNNASSGSTPTVQPIISGGSRSFIIPQTLELETLSVGSVSGTGMMTGVLWEMVSGNGGTITEPTGLMTTVTGMTAGTYVFRLTVYSNNSSSATTATITAVATTGPKYYIDSDAANDSGNGLSPATAWKTITKFNSMISTMPVGSVVHFKRGGNWVGTTLVMNASGSASQPIILTDYGTGPKPIISGLNTISSWTNVGTNLWESTSTASALSTCNILTVNSNYQPKGRMPKSGYWTILGTNNVTTISDSDNLNSSTTNWSTGTVVIRELMYEVNNYTINSMPNTTTISFNTAGDVNSGWGYFIQNHIKTCTVQNDWLYKNNKVTIYSTTTPSGVSVASIDTGINVNGESNLIFNNLDIRGFNNMGIDTTSNATGNIRISSCDFSNIGINAIYAYPNTNNLRVIGSDFVDIGSRAIYAASSDKAKLYKNTFLRVGHYAGMGSNGDDSYTAIIVNGDNAEAAYNTIINAGYCGIRWDGNSTVIRNNFVDTTNYIKDDGGGIYCYSVQNGNIPHTQLTRTLKNNVVLNTNGAPDGSPNGAQGMGLYFDGQSPNINVYNNTVSGGLLGIFINGGHDIKCTGNTTFNFTRGYHLLKIDGPITANTSTNNTYVAIDPVTSVNCGETGQYSAYFEPAAGSLPTDFVANYNIYSRPLDETDGWIWADFNGTNFCYTLNSWRSTTGRDTNSTKSPITVSDQSKIRFEYNSGATPYIVSLGSDVYKDLYGNTKTGSVTLPPYSSIILLDTA